MNFCAARHPDGCPRCKAPDIVCLLHAGHDGPHENGGRMFTLCGVVQWPADPVADSVRTGPCRLCDGTGWWPPSDAGKGPGVGRPCPQGCDPYG